MANLAAPGSSTAPLHARVLLSYLAFRAGEQPSISNLLQQAKQFGSEIQNEAEQQFHEAMLRLLASDEPDLQDVLQHVDRAIRGFPGQPVIEWVSACLNAQQSRYVIAKDHFAAIDGLLGDSPPVMVAHAEALHRIRQDDKAFWILDEIHRHGTASRSSLRLLADLPRRVDKGPQQQWARGTRAGSGGSAGVFLRLTICLRRSSRTGVRPPLNSLPER